MTIEASEFMKWVSERLIDLAPKLPKAKKYGLVEELQHHYEHRFKFQDTRIPARTFVAFTSTWMVEAFKVEDLGPLEKGLRLIFENHPRSRYLRPPRDVAELARTFQNIRKSLIGRSWTNLGFIEPNHDRDTPPLPLVDTIDFQLHSYFQNLTLLVIRAEPSQGFQSRFQKICEQHCGERVVYNWRSFISRSAVWRSSSEMASKVKNELFENLLHEFRRDVASYLGEYFSGYFLQNDTLMPAFELYLFSEPGPIPGPTSTAMPTPVMPTSTPAPSAGPPTTSPATQPFTTLDLSSPNPAFWESIGMERNHIAYADANRSAFIFDPFWGEGRGRENQAIKILIDRDKVPKESGYTSLESQIIQGVSGWVLGLSPLWVLQRVLLCIQERLPDYRDAIFQYAHSWRVRWWPFLSKMAKAKLRLNADWFTFERLRNDFRLRDIQVELQVVRGVPPFTWTHGVMGGLPRTEEFSQKMIARVRGHIHETRKIFTTINFAFSEILQVNVIRSNYWLQAIMLSVALAALAVSGVTLWVELIKHRP